MAMNINTNLSALNGQRNLTKSQSSLQTSMQRLSTGLRINSAKDDAAGLAISDRFSSQIRGLDQAARNANDGISMAQTAEGALGQISESLQRLRELAVQSANASNTDSDRASLQQEADNLLAEIDRTATQTTFNGKKLLDGTLTTQQFQIGANAGETLSVNVGSARISALGSSSVASITTAQNAGTTALKEGAYAINGVLIGPSLSSADTASTTSQAGSAIAKAAAVNLKSGQTGVTATINATEVAGTSMTGEVATGSIKLNGVDINISTTADTASTRSSIVSAINANKDQTGVTAIDSGLDTGGIKLVAADGRNIDLTLTTVTAAGTGLADTSVYSGSITLNSDKAITITSNQNGGLTTGGIKDAGLVAGTYSAQTAYASTTAYTPGVDKLFAFAAGDFKINGTLIGASMASADTASYQFTTDGTPGAATNSRAASGIAKAAAINALSAQTGVTASVNQTEVQGYSGGMTAAATTGTLTLNGFDIAITTAGVSTSDDRRAVVDAINAKSGQTGVTAVDSNDDSKGIQLVAADGRNITAWQSGGLTDAATGLNSALLGTDSSNDGKEGATFTSTLTLSSTSKFTIEAGTTANGTNALNLKVGTYGEGRSGQALNKLSIATVDGANKALTAIDNALKTISESRAQMGAVQNRFTSVASTNQVMSENLTAARSRIQDTDFAAETTNLSRAQILQQAGTAMLAQANSSTQNVLSLLR